MIPISEFFPLSVKAPLAGTAFQRNCKEISLIQIHSGMPRKDTVVAMITKHNNESDRQHHFQSILK